MDRRHFLHGVGGVAAALAVYNLAACSSGRGSGAAGTTTGPSSTTGTSAPGGTFTVPSSDDIEACQEALSGNEFIFDVHTHHVMPDRPWVTNAPSTVGLVEGMLPPDCVAGDPLECVNRAAYLNSIFLGSDTTVALLSDVPNSGPDDAPIPFADAVDTQQLAASLTHGGASRLLVHNIIAPNVGDLQARLDGMAATAATGNVAGFKVYTAWGPDGRGFALDDPAIGLPVPTTAAPAPRRMLDANGAQSAPFPPKFARCQGLKLVGAAMPRRGRLPHMDEPVIRPERREDHDAIALVVEAAFRSPVEARLVEAIRASPYYLPELSLVAMLSDQVVGHVMVSQTTLRYGDDERLIAMLSPLAVAPEDQGRGIGSALVRAAAAGSDARRAPVLILEGSPAYYGRFGFEHALPHGIRINLPSWAPPEAAQVLRLTSYDPSVRGLVVYPPAFDAVSEH